MTPGNSMPFDHAMLWVAPRMKRDLYQPHDRLFRKVFSEPAEAAGLLRGCVPPWLGGTLDWSSLTLMPDS